MSQYNTHASLSGTIQRSFKSTHLELSTISVTRLLTACAWSDGGPGLNFAEHKAGSSKFVTRNPLFGSSAFGVANSCNKLMQFIISVYQIEVNLSYY